MPVKNLFFPFRIGYNLLAILGYGPNLGLAEKMPTIKGNSQKAYALEELSSTQNQGTNFPTAFVFLKVRMV